MFQMVSKNGLPPHYLTQVVHLPVLCANHLWQFPYPLDDRQKRAKSGFILIDKKKTLL